MKKVMITSRYKLYRKGRFVREVEYQLPVEVTPKNRTRVRTMTEAMLESSRRAKLAQEDAFERLVDAASDNA